jgi:O-acetyl-ADP-ribose deacetylase (regulator of RNase III)
MGVWRMASRFCQDIETSAAVQRLADDDGIDGAITEQISRLGAANSDVKIVFIA